MSVIAHRKNVEIPATAGQVDRTTITSAVSAIVSFLRKAIKSGTRLLMHVVEVFAEARLHKAAIEAELYRNATSTRPRTTTICRSPAKQAPKATTHRKGEMP